MEAAGDQQVTGFQWTEPLKNISAAAASVQWNDKIQIIKNKSIIIL